MMTQHPLIMSLTLPHHDPFCQHPRLGGSGDTYTTGVVWLWLHVSSHTLLTQRSLVLRSLCKIIFYYYQCSGDIMSLWVCVFSSFFFFWCGLWARASGTQGSVPDVPVKVRRKGGEEKKKRKRRRKRRKRESNPIPAAPLSDTFLSKLQALPDCTARGG